MKSYNIYIDESKNEQRNEEIYCAVIIDTDLCNQYREEIHELRILLKDDIAYSEPFCSISNQRSLKKAFHMADNNDETREQFWNKIRFFDYICRIDVCNIGSDVSNTRIMYVRKLQKWIKQRYYGCCFSFIWERDDSLKIKWPKEKDVIELGKSEEELLSIPDYILGIFRKGYYNDYKEDSYRIKKDKRYYSFFETKLRYVKVEGIKKPYTYDNQYPLWKNSV